MGCEILPYIPANVCFASQFGQSLHQQSQPNTARINTVLGDIAVLILAQESQYLFIYHLLLALLFLKCKLVSCTLVVTDIGLVT